MVQISIIAFNNLLERKQLYEFIHSILHVF